MSLVVGGSGFVGRHLVAALAERGLRVTVPTRRRDRAKRLILLPTVEVVEADLRDREHAGGARCRARRRDQSRGNTARPGFQAHARRTGAGRSQCLPQGGRETAAAAHERAGRGSCGALRVFALQGRRRAGWCSPRTTWRRPCSRPSVIFGPEDRFLNLVRATQRAVSGARACRGRKRASSRSTWATW